MVKLPTVVRIQHSSRLEQNTILLSGAILKRWGIPQGQPIKLSFGSASKDVFIGKATGKSTKKILIVASSTALTLTLPSNIKLCMNYSPSRRTLKIGPLIGVLLNRPFLNPSVGLNSFCRELASACLKSGGFCYFFNKSKLSGSLQAIDGWYYHRGWKHRSMPIPDVIYNRIGNRKEENSNSVQHFIHDVKSRYHCVVFNEKFLNKNEVFEALQQDPASAPMLPESYPVKNTATIKAMLARHDTVFVKPVTGSLGRGIIRITKQRNGYQCHINQINIVSRSSYSTFSALASALSKRLSKQRFQVQQGLRLIAVHGRPVDFRVLVQRNGKGEWSVTSAVSRVAANHTFVSNLARGGSISRIENAIVNSNLATPYRSKMREKLQFSAIQIAKGIETYIPSHFAELGIDLAIDTQGAIWLLEVNSKPSKEDTTILQQQLDPDQPRPLIVRPSVKKIIDYSQFAAGLRGRREATLELRRSNAASIMPYAAETKITPPNDPFRHFT